METILDINGVSKSYEGKSVLDGISLTLERGEFLSLLGPSGSGKTTLLSTISGLVSPDSGELLLNGRRIDLLPPSQRNIGVVFQNYALFPHLTVYQNVAFPLQMRRKSSADIRTKVRKILDSVHMAEHANKFPRQLSGGQQQRVALARAIVFSPPILLMDEPLSALDKNLRSTVQMEIMSLHQKLESSIVYVTHDQDEAVAMSRRIALFNKGRIEQLGSPSDLYERPESQFVASFLGETNLLDGTVTEVGGGRCTIQGAVGLLSGKQLGHIDPGAKATVSIRPERIRIGARLADAGKDNCLKGRVERIIYLGRGNRVTVDLGNDVSISVFLQPRRKVTVGEVLELYFSVSDAVVLAPKSE